MKCKSPKKNYDTSLKNLREELRVETILDRRRYYWNGVLRWVHTLLASLMTSDYIRLDLLTPGMCDFEECRPPESPLLPTSAQKDAPAALLYQCETPWDNVNDCQSGDDWVHQGTEQMIRHHWVPCHGSMSVTQICVRCSDYKKEAIKSNVCFTVFSKYGERHP